MARPHARHFARNFDTHEFGEPSRFRIKVENLTETTGVRIRHEDADLVAWGNAVVTRRNLNTGVMKFTCIPRAGTGFRAYEASIKDLLLNHPRLQGLAAGVAEEIAADVTAELAKLRIGQIGDGELTITVDNAGVEDEDPLRCYASYIL